MRSNTTESGQKKGPNGLEKILAQLLPPVLELMRPAEPIRSRQNTIRNELLIFYAWTSFSEFRGDLFEICKELRELFDRHGVKYISSARTERFPLKPSFPEKLKIVTVTQEDDRPKIYIGLYFDEKLNRVLTYISKEGRDLSTPESWSFCLIDTGVSF